jgi:hypothetical protein
MAFIYKGSQSDLEKSGTLKLLVKSGTYGAKIRFDSVYDFTAFGSTQSSEQFQRRGVKFKGMGGYEKSKLRNYLVSLLKNPQLRHCHKITLAIWYIRDIMGSWIRR